MHKPRIIIISPAVAHNNSGNWHTAWRWSQMLKPQFACTIAQSWNGEPFDVMLALDARRSADSIARWAHAKGGAHAPASSPAPAQSLAVVLTGTELYRDIHTDPEAQASLAYAQRPVVLQECAPDALPAPLRSKARVLFQSTPARAPVVKTPRHLRAVMVGHLRDEKSPQTLFAAAQLLRNHTDIFIDHIGDALDADLNAQAQACAAAHPHYRWLGGVAHEAARRHIQRAHVLVHTSRIEGGAHVVMEAVCSATPVLASRIAGNVGMLGPHYAGYFALDDAQGLADLLLRCRATQMGVDPQGTEPVDHFYNHLQTQCAQRAPLFAPATEQAALIALVQDLLHANL